MCLNVTPHKNIVKVKIHIISWRNRCTVWTSVLALSLLYRQECCYIFPQTFGTVLVLYSMKCLQDEMFTISRDRSRTFYLWNINEAHIFLYQHDQLAEHGISSSLFLLVEFSKSFNTCNVYTCKYVHVTTHYQNDQGQTTIWQEVTWCAQMMC